MAARARNSKGRFVKGGTARRRSSARRSTALVRSSPRAITRTRTRTVVVARRRRRRGGGGFLSTSNSGGGAVSRLKSKLPLMGAAAVYGYATSGTSKRAKEIAETLKKVPTIDAIGAPATHGVLFTVIAANVSGTFGKIADLLGTAALMRAAHNFGSSNFDHEAAAKLAGDDEDVEMGGMGDGDY